jgi:hypothetical protein
MTDATASGPANDPNQFAVPGFLLMTAETDGTSDVPSSIPRDHPAWQRDLLAVSARVRAMIPHLASVTVRVLTFWDHVVRSARVGRRTIEIDPSGCYRVR